MNTIPPVRAVAFPRLAIIALIPLFVRGLHADRASDEASKDEPVHLSALEVRSDRARDEDYKADRSRIGTKTDTPLQDVPQSITVVTAEQILD